jgi:hypothetical protein
MKKTLDAPKRLELSETKKVRLASVGALASATLLLYMFTPAGPVGPPYRDESLTAGPEPMMLVQQDSIRKELQLSEEQLQQIQSAAAQQSAGKGKGKGKGPGEADMTAPRAARMGRRHQEAFLASVLQPQQTTRLRQIILQQQKGLAVGNKRTADELGLSDSQRAQADTIVDQLALQLTQFRNSRGPDGRKQFDEARTAAGENLLGLLTADQQDRWKALLGEPFAGEIRFGPPGFGPGGPGGGPKGGPGGGPKGGPKGGPGGGPKGGRPPADPAPNS